MSEETRETSFKLSVGGRNPLRGIYPRRFRSFEEWLEHWKQCQLFEEMMGLLHGFVGFRKNKQEREYPLSNEVALFFLELADGYNSHNFESSGERYRDSETEQLRKALAQKALQILCLGFFREGADYRYSPFWVGALEDEVLFERVLWFLRPMERYDGRNYRSEEKPEHPQEIFQEFVEKFAKLGWDIGNTYHRYTDRWPDEKTHERIRAARPQFIEILHHMGMLRWLASQELDEACLQKLTEMAFREEYSLPSEDGRRQRKPESLEEAVWAKSLPAQVLVIHRMKQAQQAIFDHKAEEASKKHEEEERKAELTRIAKKQAQLAQKVLELQE